MQSRSSGPKPIVSVTKYPLLRMLWCDRVAPLGNPVVPLVYWMLIGSSNWVAAWRAARSGARARPPPRDELVRRDALAAGDEPLPVAPDEHDPLERVEVTPHLVDHLHIVAGL